MGLKAGFFSGVAAGGAFGSAFGGKMNKWLQKARDFTKFIGTTLAGGISGGVGSRLAGGKFWDGFRNGAIAAGLNHAAHELQKVDPARLKARIERDGKLTWREANKWYRHGKGQPLSIDASTIDLNFLKSKNWTINQIDSRQLLLKSKSGTVYGQLTLQYKGNNKFKVFDDNYGFELHPGSLDMSVSQGLNLMFRNAATNVGHSFAGQGTPYDINFYNRIISPK
jgi:hypothetical protein